MKYKVLKYFTDLQDNRYAYHSGDLFPREGLTISDERLNELSSSNNKRGIPLIEKIAEEEPKVEPEAEVKVEAVVEPVEKPKRSGGRKKEKVNSDAE